MKEIKAGERRVKNIHTSTFEPLPRSDGSFGGESVLQLDTAHPLGLGFHIYKLEPGASSEPHQHTGPEQFLILEGQLIDNDGTVYEAGDLVWLADGTQHNSYSPEGCVIAVFFDQPGKMLT